MIGGGTTTGGSAAITISNSVASNNRSSGISADINPGTITVKLLIDNVIASGNGGKFHGSAPPKTGGAQIL